MHCPSCGREVPAGDRFCEWCGKPLAQQVSPSGRKALGWPAAAVALVVVLGGLSIVALKRRAASTASTASTAPASDVASTTGSSPTLSPASSSTGQAVVPNDSDYAKGSAALDRLESAAQVLDTKIDHSAFEIDALAAKLGSDPATNFRFVRDQIRFEPYPGVLRGALGTLICRAGNSLDRSLLLAALLQKSGLTVRIAHGTLDAQQAAALVARMFEPVKPLPPVAPALDSLVPALAQAVGATPEALRRILQQDSARDAAAAAQRWTYVNGETKTLSGLLAKSGAGPSAIVPRDRLLAEASDHYWVQYQSSGGAWVDLDPAFVAAEPGKAFTAIAATFAPDSIPDDRYHRLRVRMTLRVAQVADGADGEVHDRVLLDHELRIADQQGLGITLVNAPQPMLDPAGGGSLADALGGVKSFQSALEVGGQVISGLSFDLAGQLSGVATPEGADVKQAGGIGGTVGGMAGGIGGALGGGSAPPANGSRIVGEWVDYTVTSPAVSGEAPEIHAYRRDIVAPTVVTSWTAGDPSHPATIAATLDSAALRARLVWSAELLPVTGTLNREYAGYLVVTSLIAQRAAMHEALAHATGEHADPTNPPPRTSAIGSVDLASAAMSLSNDHGLERSDALRSYFGRPGMIAYETTIDDEASGPVPVEKTDIIAYAPRIVANPAARASDALEQATSLHVMRGVLATRLESDQMSQPSDSSTPPTPNFNTTRVFSAAAAQRVPVMVLRSEAGGVKALATLSIPDSIKAELSQDLAAGQTLVVPSRPLTVDGDLQFGWWRVDDSSGEVIGVMPGERGQATLEEAITNVLIAFNTGMCFYGAWKARGKDPLRLLYCTVATASGGLVGLKLLSPGGTMIAQGIGAIYALTEYTLGAPGGP